MSSAEALQYYADALKQGQREYKNCVHRGRYPYIQSLQQARQKPLSQIALNWSAQKPFVSSCVVGAQSGRRVRENADSFGWSLTAEESAALDEAVARCLA